MSHMKGIAATFDDLADGRCPTTADLIVARDYLNTLIGDEYRDLTVYAVRRHTEWKGFYRTRTLAQAEADESNEIFTRGQRHRVVDIVVRGNTKPASCDLITVDNAYGRWTTDPLTFDRAVAALLPSSAGKLRAIFERHVEEEPGAYDQAQTVSELLIMLCHAGYMENRVSPSETGLEN